MNIMFWEPNVCDICLWWNFGKNVVEITHLEGLWNEIWNVLETTEDELCVTEFVALVWNVNQWLRTPLSAAIVRGK
jgi:hypothetical protein